MNTIKPLENYYNNNEIDLDRIIDDFTPYITKIINNGTDNRLTVEDKEEIFSDTFFILWKNSARINIEISLKAYLTGITKNLIKERYRKLKITENISDYENDILLNSINWYESDKEIIYDVERKIKNLKNIDMQIITLFYYSSKSIQDIAKILNISKFSVKTRLHRIRRKIKRELESEEKNNGI